MGPSRSTLCPDNGVRAATSYLDIARTAGALRISFSMTKHTITTAITSIALAAVCACNKDNRENAPATQPVDQPPITRTAPAEPQDLNTPITVTGCLQKEGALMTTYIVTGVNEPSQKGIGTTGSGGAVEREQLRAAANAYRVDPKDDLDMDAMVGRQVRVSGMIAKRADLPAASAVTPNSPDDAKNRSMEKIDTSDLAKIEEASITVVSGSCGGHAEKVA
jgi:hypothetical protein